MQQRRMIICENEPAELPDDVVRSYTKIDDGISLLNLNLNSILEKFERGSASEESQPSSAGVVIEKPSFNIKKTLMAFESRLAESESEESKKNERATERPVVRKLTNIETFLNRSNSLDSDQPAPVATVRPTVVRRSGSLMMRLKKYESRIAGERVEDDSDEDNDEDENNNRRSQDPSELDVNKKGKRSSAENGHPKRLTSIDLSSLKSQWENGDIKNRRFSDEDDEEAEKQQNANGDTISNNNCNGNGVATRKDDELCRIRQQLARKRTSGGSVKNIYENAIRETQLQRQKLQASKREVLPGLDGFSATTIQQQLLKNNVTSNNGQNDNTNSPNSPTKDHLQLNLTNKANKLKEKFELGLINNSSRDDSDQSDDEGPSLTKLEQIRQEKMEDLSVFIDGEIKAREARSLFQQIDRRISDTNGRQPVVGPKSLAIIGASMRAKLTKQMSLNNNGISQPPTPPEGSIQEPQQPIRLRNNVKT